jgi:hypothetical protein
MRVAFRAGGRSLLLLVAGPCWLFPSAAPAQQADPAKPTEKVHAIEVFNGPIRTVSYFSTGASPHVLSVYRQQAQAESEFALTQQLGILKQEYVKNERLLEAQRTAAQLFFGFYGRRGRL